MTRRELEDRFYRGTPDRIKSFSFGEAGIQACHCTAVNNACPTDREINLRDLVLV